MGKRDEFRGINTALMTAFHEDGSFNEEGQRALVRYQIDHNGVDGLFAAGTIGERYRMPKEMLKELFRVCMDESGHKVRMYANISALSEEETLELAECAYELGYDAVGLIPPFFYPYTNDEIVRYYLDIADKCKLPVLVYLIPPFTGVHMNVDMYYDEPDKKVAI